MVDRIQGLHGGQGQRAEADVLPELLLQQADDQVAAAVTGAEQPFLERVGWFPPGRAQVVGRVQAAQGSQQVGEPGRVRRAALDEELHLAEEVRVEHRVGRDRREQFRVPRVDGRGDGLLARAASCWSCARLGGSRGMLTPEASVMLAARSRSANRPPATSAMLTSLSRNISLCASNETAWAASRP